MYNGKSVQFSFDIRTIDCKIKEGFVNFCTWPDLYVVAQHLKLNLARPLVETGSFTVTKFFFVTGENCCLQ